MGSLSIASSGLAVASTQLVVSAHNVANANTQGFVPAGVEVRERPSGGAEARIDLGRPEHAVEADRALLAPSRSDLVAETVNQSAAATLYRANLASLRTAQETDQALFDIVR